MKFIVIALVSAGVALGSQGHHHKHRHVDRRGGSPVEIRAPEVVTETVPGPTETIYKLQNGETLSFEQVEQGIQDGTYVLIDETSSTVVAAATSTSISPPVIPSTSTSTSATFQEAQVSTQPAASPAATSTSAFVPPPPAATSSSASVAQPATPVAASSGLLATGIDVDFPSGQIPCSQFPSAYGAVPWTYHGLSGWIGIQETPDYTPGDSSIVEISTAISGECSPNQFCSYACPAGYQKSQWPTAQGSLGQSVGGLYCNADGMLEISNPEYSTLCIQGTGTISVENTLDDQVCICRTDYPGLEAETVPLVATTGTWDLTCPDALTYYQWEGAYTSAQYYVNPAGADVTDACVWGSAGTNLGNYAPVNLGVGQDSTGTTFISLIPNAPTNPDGVLDMKIEIIGGSGTCYYNAGTYFDDNGVNPKGCTVSVSSSATYRISASD